MRGEQHSTCTGEDMKNRIIGRQEEIRALEKYLASERSEFIAVFGRRRVGKTFLVKELLEGRFCFRVTGKDNVSTREQLANFGHALSDQLGVSEAVETWDNAFGALRHAIEALPAGDAKILFFDELPWLDTHGSGFVSSLEHFWNDWATYRNDIKLIGCGSATSWMLNKLINARGGLHNRVTHKLRLAPFSLGEVEEYFKMHGFAYDRHEILDCYMAVGGVPYYLSLFDSELSVAQNLDRLCFSNGGELRGEFERLYKSIFKRAENHIAIVTTLSGKGMGMTRKEIIDAANLPNNGKATQLLNELEQCDFVRSYCPFGKSVKDTMYQLIDPFTLFYFRFMRTKGTLLPGHWLKLQATPTCQSWCGHAFEMVCLLHIEKIVQALGIDGCINTPCSWSYRPTAATLADDDDDLSHGAQIDLLIDRSDRSISVCEMKYSTHEYEIDKALDAQLARRMQIFRKVTKTRKTLIPTFVTPFGLYNNSYARRIPRQVTAGDLF